MDILHTLAIGSGLAWASGMRLYAVVFFAGLLGRLGVITLPGHLGVLTHSLVIAVAGVLVGLGTRFASGCTSGHGVCGLSRLSPRSLVATLSFMAAGFAIVFLVRHAL